MNCDHKYVCILQANVTFPYAIVMCADCGHMRHLYPDGKVIIVKQNAEIKDRTK